MPVTERAHPVRLFHPGCILRLIAEAVEPGEARPYPRRYTCRSALSGNENEEN